MPDSELISKGLQIDGSMGQEMETVLFRLDEKMGVLENLVKKVCDDNYRHGCCIEVLHKLQVIESLLQSTSINSQKIQHMKPDQNENVDSSLLNQSSDDPASQVPVLLVNNQKPGQVAAQLGLDSTVQVITLNSESDFECGSWLGDENNPEARVRCKIPPVTLIHINSTCLSPEKMAVTLLDHLFPREVLAVSNLTGKGKHGKKQLDPLMVYGIRCHLMYKFNITEGDWYRIKQNMDSKCRTAWRKRSRGLPLGGIKAPYLYTKPVKLKNYHINSDSRSDEEMLSQHHLHEVISEDGQSIIVSAEAFLGDNSEEEQVAARVLHTEQGNIQVLHATTEQLLRMQQRHHIQVLRNDQLLTGLQEGEVFCTDDSVIEEIDGSEHMLTIVTSSGDNVADMEAMESHQEFVDEDSLDMSSKQAIIEGDESCEENMSSVQYIVGE